MFKVRNRLDRAKILKQLVSFCRRGYGVFHDTCKIDGCREFIIDLITKYNDGTYDIINLPWDNKHKRSGISILQKRTYPVCGYKIDEICGPPSEPKEIYEKEKIWYKKEGSR